jgi:hypothetical protein
MLKYWRDYGEDRLADWFQKELFLSNFSVTSSKYPGADCCNQHVESTNRNEKRDMSGTSLTGEKKKIDVGYYLQNSTVHQCRKHTFEKGHEVPIYLKAGDTPGRPFMYFIYILYLYYINVNDF